MTLGSCASLCTPRSGSSSRMLLFLSLGLVLLPLVTHAWNGPHSHGSPQRSHESRARLCASLSRSSPWVLYSSSSPLSWSPVSSTRAFRLLPPDQEEDEEKRLDISLPFPPPAGQWKLPWGLGHFPERRNDPTVPTPPPRRFQVFCDLDGVLVDFCAGIRQLYHDDDDEPLSSWSSNNASCFNVDDLHRPDMWHKVSQADSFFEHLPWMDTGRDLWQVVRQLEPTILTGVPAHPRGSRQQKVAWCQRELGLPHLTHVDKAGDRFQHMKVDVGSSWFPSSCRNKEDDSSSHSTVASPTVITCWSRNKHYESGTGKVLIDDRVELKQAWESKGGIFIHHTGCAHRTIAQLERHGVLQEFAARVPLTAARAARTAARF